MPTHRILFVCLGNICRSPSAETIMQHMIEQAGLSETIHCDSAGTIGVHQGEPADTRMRKHLAKRGYNSTVRSRKFIAPTDFDDFDLVLAMDDANMRDLTALATGTQAEKLQKMTDYCRTHDVENVPDPYYGGDAGFETVIDLLEDACSNLLEQLTGK